MKPILRWMTTLFFLVFFTQFSISMECLGSSCGEDLKKTTMANGCIEGGSLDHYVDHVPVSVYYSSSLPPHTETLIEESCEDGVGICAKLPESMCESTSPILMAVPGEIFAPASIPTNPMDPNGNGWITTSGGPFGPGHEIAEFELPYIAIAEAESEPDSDLQTGSNCSFTDIVADAATGSVGGYYLITDPDGIADNGDELLMLRMRLAQNGNGAFGFSFLLDTDNLFSVNDPNSMSGNPGFEYEIIIGSGINNDLAVFDVDGSTTGSLISTYDKDLYSQKAYALNTDPDCSGDPIFWDFYVLLDDVGLNIASNFRMIFATSSSPNSALGGSASDIGGVDGTTTPNDDDQFIAAIAAIAVPEICGDNIDNNGDGLVDEGCQDCSDCSQMKLINGGLETNSCAGFCFEPTLNGWTKSPADDFELWPSGFGGAGFTFTAYEGSWAMELNAFVPSTIYQVMAACPGETYQVSFAHMARDLITEQVNFVVYDHGSDPAPGQGNIIFSGATIPFITTRTWVFNQFIFTLPPTYTGGALRLEFQSSGGASASQGNLVDAFDFTLIPCITPIAVDDVATVDQNTTGNVIDVQSNDDSPNGLPLNTTIIGGPTSGGTAVVINGDSISYDPPVGFVGTDTITYQVCDAALLCDTAIVVITVNPTNGAPIAMNDTVTGAEDDPLIIAVLGNDNDPDGNLVIDSLAIRVPPQNGSLVINANGTITYTPNPNFYGPDAFSYQICDDGMPVLCDTAYVVVNITNVNDAPIAANEVINVDEDSSTSGATVDSNDFDPDNPNVDLTWSILDSASAGMNGTLVFIADGSFNYTPDPNFNGTVQFTYLVCDPSNLCDTAIAFIAVAPVNDPPVAVDDLDNTQINTLFTTNVIANDSDPNDPGGGLDVNSLAVISGPFHGIIVVNNNGTITYDPDLGYGGLDSLVYVICDVGDPLPALCDTATLVIQIGGLPTAMDDIATGDEDIPIVIDILDNDTTPDGTWDLGSITILNGPTNGTVVIDTLTGLVTFIPDTNWYGTDDFTYRVCNTLGQCSNATVSVIMSPVNDPPVAVNDLITTTEETPVTVSVASNDDDPNDPTGNVVPGTVSIIGTPANGMATVNSGTGAITYTPAVDFYGVDSLQYLICDDGFPAPPACDSAWVVITVSNVNDDPVIVDSLGAPVDTVFVTTPEDSAITICLNVIDVDGDTVDVVLVGNGPSNGSVSNVNTGDTCFTYTPALNFNGTDGAFAIVCDNNGGCDTVYVDITVTPVNDPPDANTDVVGLPPGSGALIDVQGNDTDPDGDPLVTTIISGPTSGGVATVINGDSINYNPPLGFAGADTIIYMICDPSGLCDTDTVFIFFSNLPPIIVDGNGVPTDTLNGLTNENTPLFFCISANDPNNDPIDVTSIINGPDSGSVSGIADGDTCFTYTPAPDFFGTDTMLVFVCDTAGLCDSVVVIITVLEFNDPPVIVDGSGTPIDTLVASMPEDSVITICLNAIDPEGHPVDVNHVLNGPVNGTISGLANSDTCFTYTPDPNFNGIDTMLVVVCDTLGACDSITVIIIVTPVNDAPIIVDGTGSSIDTTYVNGSSGDPTIICLDAIDVDGDTLDITSILNGPSSGTVGAVAAGDTCFTYTSIAGFTGSDTLTAVVCDNMGACDTVVVVLTITTNQPPFAVDDTATVVSGSSVIINNEANDSDPNGDPFTTTAATAPNGTVVINGNGTLTYTPNAGYCDNDTITYTVCDTIGLCDNAIIVVDIQCAPIAVDDAVITDEDMSVTIDNLINDSDPDGDPFTTTSVSANNGSVTINANGSVTYTPDPDFCGNDVITYVICDNTGLCDTATIDVTVVCINDPPIAVDDNSSVSQGGSVVINNLGNDIDPDGDPLNTTVATAIHGTVVINTNGTITYTPDPSFCGTDTISYTVCDNGGLCDDAIIVVQVICNDPPIAVDDVASVLQGGSVIINNEDNDSDPNGDPFSTTIATAINGTVVINGNGTLTYTPDPEFCGTDTISYTICDSGGLCDGAIILVTVECAPDELLIPQGFSPAVSGMWVIQGLEIYPNNSIVIFNRWGNEVFTAAPYLNDWDGRSTNSLGLTGVLPSGTYYYILTTGVDEGEPKTGFIYLNTK